MKKLKKSKKAKEKNPRNVKRGWTRMFFWSVGMKGFVELTIS